MKRTQEIAGTYLQGQIRTTRRELTRVFGEPIRYEDSKTTIEWGIVFEGGILATIYDWKRYELGEPEQDEMMVYNIGGLSPEAVSKVKELVSEEVTA